ncbi:MAG: metallophosphoesterase [Nitrospirae bacterium]|nr:metallophosphoesterase [Nitrospirota bacterium]MBU6482902.1 metallophosphoesterase [Nitrospirota bacterium]MDE3220192.1 metallophosphoesterase [Nitrospirota bacterium]
MHMNIQEPAAGQRRRRATSQVVLCVLVATLSFVGCSGGGTGGSGAPTANTGQALISVTDAAGDFLSYVVNVQSLTLTRQDGTEVETLPLTTRINFADYVDLTEFFTAATIPSGTYISARMRLDFSTADLQVEDSTGNAISVPVANIQDAQGNPITTLDVTVRFDDRRALVIAPGVPSHLTLDFNLRASNTVDLTVTPPVVTVKPFLVADVDPQNPKTMRLRGPLDSVNQQNHTYQVFLRPMFGPLGSVPLSTFGSVTVHTDTNTVFEIDQVTSQGDAGLTALAAKPTGTATVAIGEWEVVTKQFKANEVLAGSSVPGGTRDVVTGVVMARSGDQLTVRGATLVRSDGTFTFHETVTVNVGATTTVRQQALMTTGLTKDAISVGQQLTAFGTFNVSTNTLDATTGLVRLLVTSVAGTVNTTGTGSLQINVQRIQGRRIALFNFAGTGTSTTTDADPTQYQVATGLLDLTALTTGTPVRVLGFVTPFHTAPPDFTAQTLVNLVDDPATLVVNWSPPTAGPFTSNTDAGLVLDLTGVGTAHYVWRGPVATDLLGLGSLPTIVPANPIQGLFAVGSSGQIQVFTQFHDYSLALQQRLAQGQKANAVGAHGMYSDSSVSITADQIYMVLK